MRVMAGDKAVMCLHNISTHWAGLGAGWAGWRVEGDSELAGARRMEI